MVYILIVLQPRYLQFPGGGQIFVFFGSIIGTAIGLGIDIGYFMNN